MKLTSVVEVYTQDEDSCGRQNVDVQELTVSSEDAGGGGYLILVTKRWALDCDEEIDALAALLKDFLKRI